MNKVSTYWDFIDYEIAYYSFCWQTEESRRYLEANEISFLTEYVNLTFKYGMLIPFNIDSDSDVRDSVNTLVKESTAVFPEDWVKLRFNRLYVFRESLLPVCALFTDRGEGLNLEYIADAYSLLPPEDLKRSELTLFSGSPVSINFLKDHITITFGSDALLFELINLKTSHKRMDNSSTAFLNAPRFNSFLREFKELCHRYKASNISSEVFSDSFSDAGISWKGDVLFYEDIYDLIPEEHRYKPPVAM